MKRPVAPPTRHVSAPRHRRRLQAVVAGDPAAAHAVDDGQAPPVDIEQASERRGGPIEAGAPRPDPNDGVSGFLEPDDAPDRDEPLLQPPRGA